MIVKRGQKITLTALPRNVNGVPLPPFDNVSDAITWSIDVPDDLMTRSQITAQTGNWMDVVVLPTAAAGNRVVTATDAVNSVALSTFTLTIPAADADPNTIAGGDIIPSGPVDRDQDASTLIPAFT